MSVKPPLSDNMPEVVFSDIETVKLGNVNIYFIEDNTQDLFNCMIVNLAGSSHDTLPGLSYLTHILLSYGSSKSNYEEISLRQDMLGAYMSSQCNADEGGIKIISLAEHYEKSMDIMLECYFSPAFTETELERVQKKVTSSIRQSKADPGFLASYAMMKAYYGEHPYSHASFGDEESITKITSNDVLDFYNNVVLRSEHAVFVSGKFDKESVIEKLKSHISKFPEAQAVNLPVFGGLQKQISAVIDKKNAQQSNLIIASEGIAPNSTDLPAVKIANVIFGGYFMSRLNEILREQHGFTYGIGSHFRHRRLSNEFMISSSLNTENLRKAIDIINDIKNDFSSNPVSDEEFTRAVRYYTGNFTVNLESHMQIANLVKGIFIHKLDKDHYKKLLENIMKLSINDVFEAQQKYFNPANSVIAVSGEPETINKELTGLGELITINA